MNQNQQQSNNTNNTSSSHSEKISQGFEQLVYDLSKKDPQQNKNDFDVIIIGSGYGGSIAAAELSACHKNGQPLSVCVLERGKEYLPGNFPASFSEIPKHVRFNITGQPEAKGTHDGLFDFRINGDISALMGNGLGGGSLINAGVMEIPVEKRFNKYWPSALQNRDALLDYYQEAKVLLGAATKKDTTEESSSDNFNDNTIEVHQKQPPQKFSALKKLGKNAQFRTAAITVAMQDKVSCSGLKLNACNYCGDCATGCNFGAKESLDTNLLDLAHQQGATLVTGATVLRLEKEETNQSEDGNDASNKRWKVFVTYTDKTLRKRQGEALVITAERVVLSAGTFGSTEILMRSESKALRFSNKLSKRFSGNGDMIASVYQQKQTVNAISKRELPPTERNVGPTITGIIEAGIDPQGSPFIIEELAVPNILRQFYEELTTTTNLLKNLNTSDKNTHRKGSVQRDPWSVDSLAMENTAVLAIFGDDGAKGKLQFHGDKNNNNSNGCLNVSWPEIKNDPLCEQQLETINNLTKNSSVKGTLLPNPMWKFLPDGMDYLAEGNKRGPLLTVHPLGGCVMADNFVDGVVDHYGRVFNAGCNDDIFHEGLVVLDGAIIPSALGTNPALTIAAVSLRAVKHLIDKWELKPSVNLHQSKVRERPIYRDAMDDYNIDNASTPAPAIPTKIQLIERLGGEVTIKNKQYYMDITTRYHPSDIRQLSCSGEKRLQIDGQQQDREDDSRLRLLDYEKWIKLTNGSTPDSELENKLNEAALFIAPLSGDLTIFERESSCVFRRRLRAIFAWLLNRGLRDIYQAIENRSNSKKLNIFQRIKSAWALSSRAGEVRTLNYDLHIGPPLKQSSAIINIADRLKHQGALRGTKRLTYSRRANPWRQLMELKLENFPGNVVPVLKLDTKFLARQSVPLLKIVQQQDQPTALADCASFMAYIFRFLLNMHLWSFRLPDKSNPESPQRYPGNLPGLPKPEIKELYTDDCLNGEPVTTRLTRYANPGKPPLIAIHGYSIGGSIFTHPNIGTNATQYFSSEYDIWILDLRTSSAKKSALHNWSFEDVAFKDIPIAFQHVYEKTGQKLNVIAHCMGAAMLSMAILKAPENGDDFYEARDKLPDWINCLALSQVGPRVNFSPDNILRTYILKYIIHFLPLADYKFRIEGEPSLADLLLDRALATLPYPEEEFDLENPPWPPWRKTPFTRTRHRADALYGRDFSLKNVETSLLKNIDDIFGYLNIQTVSQTIHFAQWKSITTKQGYNEFVSRDNFIDRWCFNTFSVHGEDNDLSDVSTVKLMEKVLKDAELSYDCFVYPDHGHLDCLIGRDAKIIFKNIQRFFDKNRTNLNIQVSTTQKEKEFSAIEPTVGPQIGNWFQVSNPLQNKLLPVSVGSSPGMTEPFFTVVVPVKRLGDRFIEVKDNNAHRYQREMIIMYF